MRGYQRPWLRIDVLAGLAAGTVVVPQAMAYATIAGLPVEVGLYTCMVPMIAYALLGGARTLSVSTTSTIAVLVASTLAGLSARSAGAQLDAAFTLTVLVGLCLLAMRLFRLGGLIENISPATLTGIRLGVGLTVAASQLPALLGVGSDPDATGFFARLKDSSVPAVGREHDDGRRLARHARRPGAPAAVRAPSSRTAHRRRGRHPPGGDDLGGGPWPRAHRARADRSPRDLPPGRLGRLLVAPGSSGHRRDGVPRDRARRPPEPSPGRAADRHRPGAARRRSRLRGGRLHPVAPARRRLLAECGEHPLGGTHPVGVPDHGGARRARRALPRSAAGRPAPLGAGRHGADGGDRSARPVGPVPVRQDRPCRAVGRDGGRGPESDRRDAVGCRRRRRAHAGARRTPGESSPGATELPAGRRGLDDGPGGRDPGTSTSPKTSWSSTWTDRSTPATRR